MRPVQCQHQVNRRTLWRARFQSWESFQIDGDAAVTREVESLLRNLYAETENSELLKSNDVQGAITRLEADSQTSTNYLIKIRKTTIRPSSKTQENYLRSIANNTITIGVGPAGTGKTYLAVASAVHALANDSASRIVLVRPVVEAGERIGFLPGDIEKKVNPYLRPLYDALYEMLGFERVGDCWIEAQSNLHHWLSCEEGR